MTAKPLRNGPSEKPDLMLLDLMLPKMNGLDVVRLSAVIRKQQIWPIIMLTAKGEEIDKIIGLESVRMIT